MIRQKELWLFLGRRDAGGIGMKRKINAHTMAKSKKMAIELYRIRYN